MTEIRRIKLKKTGLLRGIFSYVLIIGLVIIAISNLNESVNNQISYTTLMSKIEAKEVKSISLSYDRTDVKVVYKNDTVTRYATIPSNTSFMDSIERGAHIMFFWCIRAVLDFCNINDDIIKCIMY